MSILVAAHSSLPIRYVTLSDASHHKFINWYLMQVKYYAGAGDRATSDAPIPENQTQAFGSLAGPTFSQN
jgi:hypothetical protein